MFVEWKVKLVLISTLWKHVMEIENETPILSCILWKIFKTLYSTQPFKIRTLSFRDNVTGHTLVRIKKGARSQVLNDPWQAKGAPLQHLSHPSHKRMYPGLWSPKGRGDNGWTFVLHICTSPLRSNCPGIIIHHGIAVSEAIEHITRKVDWDVMNLRQKLLLQVY